MYTSEELEKIKNLVNLMRESGVKSFTAGTLQVEFDQVRIVVPELSSEDKLEMLKQELARESADADADLLWSVG